MELNFGGFFDWIGEKFGWIGEFINSIFGAFSTVGNFASNALGFEEDPQERIIKQINQPVSAQALSSNNQTINVNFSGAINVATNNGVFDMREFEKALITSAKRALKTDEMNEKNTDIRG